MSGSMNVEWKETANRREAEEREDEDVTEVPERE